MSNGRPYRRRRPRSGLGASCGPGNTRRVAPGPASDAPQLRTWPEWEADPTCPRCGPIERLSTGWLFDKERASVLCCGSCWLPLVAAPDGWL